MKKTADRAKARMSKRATAATTTPETIPIWVQLVTDSYAYYLLYIPNW
jgi:hypothetical protein